MNKNTWKWGPGRQWAVTPQLSGGYKEVHKKQASSFLFLIGVELINNAVSVSGAQQSDSATHTPVLFQTLLPSRSPQNTEQSSLC